MNRKKKINSLAWLLLFTGVVIWGAINGTKSKERIVIAVLDTGYNGTNPRVIREGDTYDLYGHGTALANLILERTEEEVYLLPVKITDGYGQATIDSAYQGFLYAMEQDADIINFSLTMGKTEGTEKLEEVIQLATDQGIEVIVSAGNHGTDTKNVFPANSECAIVVSALDSDNNFCSYSNFGQQVDFSAYGGYEGDRGTSYAAARVSAMLANELANGGSLKTLKQKVTDGGEEGWDEQYGYGILAMDETNEKEVSIVREQKKSENDLGYDIMTIDWKELDADTLNAYFTETDCAYVGMFLAGLNQEELIALQEKADILKSDILVQTFQKIGSEGKYSESEACREDFLEYAKKEYLSLQDKLTVSAEFLILQKNTGEFAISSENRENIYYYQISGFSYRTDTPDSSYFQIFDPDTLKITRTIVKQENPEFTAPYVLSMEKYLCGAEGFAIAYQNPETGAYVENKNFRAIEYEADSGHRQFGLSITMGGYSSGRTGYHTSDEDIIQIPYNYQHLYSQYTYAAYPQPLTYYFGRETGIGQVEWMTEPQRVNVQPKSFKTLLQTGAYTVYYDGTYYPGYHYGNLDYSLSLSEMLSRYMTGYRQKTMYGVNIPTSQNSISGDRFTVNFNLLNSMAIQWNNGETATKVIKNDIPEYNFPLVVNSYFIRYQGNGATGGTMADTAMTYNTTKSLEQNRYTREGYQFKGWSLTAGGKAVYTDAQLVRNLTAVHNAVVNLYAVWEPAAYLIRFHGNGAEEGSMPDLKLIYNQTVALNSNVYKRRGYQFIGWSYTPDGAVSYADGAYVKNLTNTAGKVIDLYAKWSAVNYKILFDSSGGKGYMETVTAVYDLPLQLPREAFEKETEYGPCVFKGWSIHENDLQVQYQDNEFVLNLTSIPDDTVVLYAVWDECPWILAEDLYFSLEEAKSGLITYEELMSRATAMDKEAGGEVLPGVDDEKKTVFLITDYAETDFLQLEHEGSVTETYRVTDSSGSTYQKKITVYVVDTNPEYCKVERTTRFINEKYYRESYEKGGLSEKSIWKMNSEYVAAIEKAFANSANDTPLARFYFTRDEILRIQDSIP